MFSFGKKPVRSIESFGVAGLLDEGCHVFYENLFSTHHLGRVSDLLSARLREAGLDELKFRALLLFGFFEAYRSHALKNAGKLSHPLVIECGVDGDKVAIGVSFTLPEKAVFDGKGIMERLVKRQPKSPFEALLAEVYSNADRLVIRIQQDTRRVELVSLLGIPGKIDPKMVQTKAAPEVVMLKPQVTEAPKAGEYVQLSDLDYGTLLREEKLLKEAGKSAEKEKTVTAASGAVLAESFVKGAQERIREEAQVVKGKEEAPDHSTKTISGVTERIDDSVRVKGSNVAVQDEQVTVVSGPVLGPSGSKDAKQGEQNKSASDQIKVYEEKISELERKLAELEAQRGLAPGEVIATSSDQQSVSAGEAIKGFFRKVWPFSRRRSGAAGEVEGLLEGPTDGEAITGDADAPGSKSKGDAAETAEIEALEAQERKGGPKAEAGNPAVVANSLMIEIQAGSFDTMIKRAQKEVVEIKSELGSQRAKRWVDGLMSDIVAEKAKLHEFSKKLNQMVRQKELEFRNKEQGFQEELRRRDEMIRQKNNALVRAKDQVSEVTMTLERVKSNSMGAADDAHYKQKHALTQKMLTATKEENVQLVNKVEDLKKQLASAQMASKSRSGPSTTEFSALQSKFERVNRQCDELKKTNVQLNEKLAENKKERISNANIDDMRKRLEAATKLSSSHQKEAEQLKLRVEELQREESRLKKELARTQQQAESAPSRKPPGGQSGSAPPKAA